MTVLLGYAALTQATKAKAENACLKRPINGAIYMSTLLLEKFTPQDFDDYYRLVGNADVMAMITERALPEAEARRDFDALLDNNQLHPAFGQFKVLDATGTFIGLGKLALESVDSREAELGYMLLPEYWGKGLGGRIAAQLLLLAKDLPLDGLFAIIDPANLASRKILIRHGFTHREFKDFDGLPGEILQLFLKPAMRSLG